MDKLLWVLTPVALSGAVVAVLARRGRLPSRLVLNAVFSLLLMVYLLVTAGLGIFWVAHQHLPVFDWHCVFGYAMLVLLAVHLAFTFRVLWHTLRRRKREALGAQPAPLRTTHQVVGFSEAVAFAFKLHVGHRAAGGAGCFHDGAALLRRNGLVLVALQRHQRAMAAAHVQHRAALVVEGPALPALRQRRHQTVEVVRLCWSKRRARPPWPTTTATLMGSYTDAQGPDARREMLLFFFDPQAH